MSEHDRFALAGLREAVARAPLDHAAHRALSAALRQAGDAMEADVEGYAAAAIEAGEPMVIFHLATVFFTAGQKTKAASWYELALMLDPDMAIARRNLASIRFDQGHREEAQAHRDRAYRKQCIHINQALQEQRRVLMPVRYLIPGATNTRIEWFIEYATPDTELPAHDIVFNAVGDPDVEEPLFVPSCDFIETSAKPWLNHPAHVSRTRRDRLPGLLQDIADIEVPPVRRVKSLVAALGALGDPGMTFPLLLRPAASHGGEGLLRIEDPIGLHAIGERSSDAWYLSPFRNYRSADGYFRKYRMIFVDREPYPYHLALSSHWLVHYATAEMLSDPAKCGEERRFLDDPESALGEHGMAAIRAIGQRLDLDYAGVDFTILADGRVLVFEANATMLVHPEAPGPFDYKNPFVSRILGAFETMMANRIAEIAALPGDGTAEIVEILQTGRAVLREQDFDQVRHAFLDGEPCLRAAQGSADPARRHEHHCT